VGRICRQVSREAFDRSSEITARSKHEPAPDSPLASASSKAARTNAERVVFAEAAARSKRSSKGSGSFKVMVVMTYG
jgi:hypothetical protein